MASFCLTILLQNMTVIKSSLSVLYSLVSGVLEY